MRGFPGNVEPVVKTTAAIIVSFFMSRDHAHRILKWLDAIVPVPDIQSSERPCKRLRLENNEYVHDEYSGQILNGDRATRLRSPPESGSGSVPLLSKLPNMPPARRTNQTDRMRDTLPEEDDEGQEHGQVSSGSGLQVELTPRPARRKASAMDKGAPTSLVTLYLKPIIIKGLVQGFENHPQLIPHQAAAQCRAREDRIFESGPL
ncbi:uncharacterized protein KD926_011399 [Aspergillus affinis]|uniref:uncharacterized protein n=1 Tax=Aspergillus affinis TaxID=1070780 RepID=UPI0022FE407C|nr:uncharacterized protein KD926_011399 [Aspergillus affinis]KAI9037967.1 hypothetical protein KD926_011399 [Aspergillus affinis]